MTNESSTQGLDQELTNALEELRTSLQHAADATASIQRIVPRVTQIGTLFDELASVINTGRAQLGSGTATFSRPTLVPTPQPTPAPSLNGVEDPWTQLADTWTPATDGDAAPVQSRPSVSSANLVSFRLEFESKPGPLDLRAVDDAVSEHPSVRDVALIDYDGRKATLKVWIEDSATPESVHAALAEQAATLFGPDNEVTVVALADAA
jgi:hypothetical protein